MKEKNYKKCVICGKEYPCTPSRNVVTCSRECRLKYLSQNHKGLKMSAATREKMAESRKGSEQCRDTEDGDGSRQEKPEIWAIYNQQGGDRLALSQSGRGAFPYSLPCLLAEGKSRDVWR